MGLLIPIRRLCMALRRSRRRHGRRHPHSDPTSRQELDIILRLGRPRRRRRRRPYLPLRRNPSREASQIQPQLELAVILETSLLPFPAFRRRSSPSHSGQAVLAALAHGARVAHQVRQHSPVLRLLAFGWSAFVPGLQEGFEAGRALGDEGPVHRRLGEDVERYDGVEGLVGGNGLEFC